MKIIVFRNTFVGGDLVKASKKPVDMDDKDAQALITAGKAVAVSAKKEAVQVAAAQAEVQENANAEAEAAEKDGGA